MNRTGEQGVALVFTLFLMAALSAMAVSMMFLAQTETSASRNYKTMSQARYAGEAGVHKAIHYLSSTTYTDLVTSTTGFNTTVSPVTLIANNNPVVLAPLAANSNHPSTTIKNAYAALFNNVSMSVGNGAIVRYSATATLLSMRQVNVYGGTTGVVQTWRIDAVGTVPGAQPATVEVGAILERNSAPAETYAIFATGNGCGAITMSGDVHTDSYDSTSMTMSGGFPATQDSGGSVGTNGNLSIGGQVTVNGNLDTPRTGVGNCSNGNITALSTSGRADVSGDMVKLPQAKVYPAPNPPLPSPTTGSLSLSSASCSSLLLHLNTLMGQSCSVSSGVVTIRANGQPVVLPNLSVQGGVTLAIEGGSNPNVIFNVNSISLSGNANLMVGSNPANTSITMNVRGEGVTGDVVDFTGGAFLNNSFDPSRFQILYAGTGTMKYSGGAATAATVYAPNADVSMHGNGNFFGSVLSKKFTDTGGASVHYDRSLATKFNVLGNHVMSSFSWQKY